MVDLVRRELPDVSTLAIGDGANDVSMINAAHVGKFYGLFLWEKVDCFLMDVCGVGIGIRGKEGT